MGTTNEGRSEKTSAAERAYLAGLRPSRIRDVQAGAPACATVDLIDIDGFDANALRSPLESFGLAVRLHRVGQARHLAVALGGGVSGEFAVLCCHGDDERILIPELAEEMERFQPFHGSLGPDEVRSITALNGPVVITTGCGTGTDTLAQAFLDSGASAYVAPVGAPFGYASVFAPLFLFYELTEGRTLEQAIDRLTSHDGRDHRSLPRLDH